MTGISSPDLYAILAAANLALMLYLIRRYSLFSAEGLALAFIALAMASDVAGLFWAAAVSPNELRQGTQEFDIRLYPSMVHLLALIAFGTGLIVSNPRPTPFRRRTTPELQKKIFVSGLVIAAAGVGLYGMAVVLIGAYQNDYYTTLDRFRSEELPFGGFWYRGVDIFLFGVCLMFATGGSKGLAGVRRFLVGMAILALPMLLMSNKGGLEKSFMFGAFALYFADYGTFKRLATMRIVAPAILILVVATGAKNLLLSASRSDFDINAVTLSNTSDSGLASISDRYSNEGLYRGYCTMVNALHAGEVDFYNGRILRYTLNSWIPRALRPDKADHPFRAIGYMINPDGHVYSREVSAPTFVGYGYGDFGMASAISYLFVGGLFAGLFRRFCTSSKGLYLPTAYTFFALLGGISAEGGFIGVIYTIVMVFVCATPVKLVELYLAERASRTSIGGRLSFPNSGRAIQSAGDRPSYGVQSV